MSFKFISLFIGIIGIIFINLVYLLEEGSFYRYLFSILGGLSVGIASQLIYSYRGNTRWN